MSWLESIAEIEELEDAVFDAELVAELEDAGTAAVARPIRFSTPTFKEYTSSELQGCGKNSFPAFSITAGGCALMCDHCQAGILEPMIPATSPEMLDRKVRDLVVLQDLQGFLLSGGSTRRNEIRYLRFCYFDGSRWWDSWSVTGESPLPQLVQVTIGFEGFPPFGEETGVRVVNDEFCTCLNEDPVDCLPLEDDQYSVALRVPQADPLFRSRVSRETQASIRLMAHENPRWCGLNRGRLPCGGPLGVAAEGIGSSATRP